MSDELTHKDPGASMTQAEFIGADGTGHVFNSQATGDIPYASSATVIKRLAVQANSLLGVVSGIPAWKTYAETIQALLVSGYIRDIPMANWTEGHLANTGSSTSDQQQLEVASGATASSTAARYSAGSPVFHPGAERATLNFAKAFFLVADFFTTAQTGNGIVDFTLGKASGDGVGNLANKGYGFRIANNALYGLVYGGSGFEATNLSVTLTNLYAYTIAILGDGAGNVSWFVDTGSGIDLTSATGTTANGPTGTGSSGDSRYQLEALNGADSANMQARISRMIHYIAR